MNLIDRLVSLFSPAAGLRRVQAREAIREYNAGGSGKAWAGTNPRRAASADARNARMVTTVVDRHRQMVADVPIAGRAVDAIAKATVGAGIRPAMESKAGRVSKTRLAAVRTAWEEWADDTACDFYGKMTFYGLQSLIVRTIATDGECLVRMVVAPGLNAANFQLQVLPREFLDRAKTTVATTEGGHIYAGIEYDKDGRRLAYWMFRHHPDGHNGRLAAAVSERVPASSVLHLYDVKEAGQTIGIPAGVPAMAALRDTGELQQAQLTKQKVAACFVGYVESAITPHRPSQHTADLLPERIEPGMIHYLNQGEKVGFATPPPADGYGEFQRAIDRSICAGYHLPATEVMLDFERINFSSGRLGKMTLAQLAEYWAELLLIPQFCRPVMREWMKMARVSGLSVPELRVTWTAPKIEMVNPLQEAKATVELVRAGLLPWQEAVRAMGYDPNEVKSQLSEDAAMFDELGIMPFSDPRFDTNRVAVNEEPKNEPENE